MKLGQLVLIALALLLIPHMALAEDELAQGIKQIAADIAKSTRDESKRTIAVVDFANLDGSIGPFGQYLAEGLGTELFLIAPEKFEVVERRRLSLALSEQKLTVSQLFDAKSLPTVGKLLGARQVATGTITDIGDMVEINAKLITVETGGVAGVAKVRIRKQGTVQVFMSQDKSQPASERIGEGVPSSTAGGESQDSVPLARGTTEGGMILEVTAIRRVGTAVYIDFVATSPKRDMEVTVQGAKESRLIDSAGVEKFASRVSFGQKTLKYSVTLSLIQGVRTNGKLEFENVPPETTKLAAVEIKGSAKPDPDSQPKKWALTFRDLLLPQ